MALPDKVAAALVSLTAFLPSLFTNELSIPIVGVGMSTVAGAALGTYAAIGYDDAVHPRGKLFTVTISTIIISSAATGVFPAWMGWEWVNKTVEGGVAGLFAVVVYYGLPEAIPALRRLIRNFKLSDINIFRRSTTPPADPPAMGPPGEGDAQK